LYSLVQCGSYDLLITAMLVRKVTQLAASI